MFRRIVIPTDGRSGSVEATRFAARLARAHRAEIVACYVVDHALVARTPGNLRERLRRELDADGRRALREVTSICRRAGVACRETLLEGDPVGEIVTSARRVRADLVIMRTTGRGRLASLFLGSPALSIVGRAPCPVLLVRPGTARRRRRAPVRATRAART